MNKYILLIFVCEDVLISSFISVYAQVITDCTPNVRIFTDRDSFRTARVCVCVCVEESGPSLPLECAEHEGK